MKQLLKEAMRGINYAQYNERILNIRMHTVDPFSLRDGPFIHVSVKETILTEENSLGLEDKDLGETDVRNIQDAIIWIARMLKENE